ncbi:MAG: AAA family ATPase [Candidatus Firestonebacteria bacterium]
MYIEYWKLKEKPFENTPDPKFIYLSAQHEEGLSRLLYIIREEKGCGLLTGIFGCGKTLLSRALLTELEKDIYKVAFVINPIVEEVDLLRLIAHHLGSSELPNRKTDILIKLEELIKNNWRDGKKTVIVIDEAHAIENTNVFEEIRLLLNFQLEDKFLITILLIGQPELKVKVDANKQLAQRVAMRYHLIALNRKETEGFISHRLKVAGGNQDIFTIDAINLIFERSGGIPRRINQIGDMCLVVGLGKKLNKVDVNVVQEAIDSLGGAD